MDNQLKIYFDGQSGPITPNSVVSLGLYVDSASPINAFDLSIIFPKDKFEFLGSDNTSSIVDIWQTKPENSVPGSIEMSGGIPQSFTGSKGLLVKLSFKAKYVAGAENGGKISFEQSDFFLADGQGTKVVATATPFNIAIRKDSKIVADAFTPFEPTPSDVIIAEELQSIQTEADAPSSLTMPAIIFLLIIFVICALSVYNKRKRKL